LALSAAVLLAQLAHSDPLIDVVRGGSPADAQLTWPVSHVIFAPFTLLADWLNGGSRWDLKNFALWLLVGYILARLAATGRADAPPRRRAVREARSAVVFCLSLAVFAWWGTRWNRPAPRLVAADSSFIIFDVHSHTSASHDGRPGFGAAENARWHARLGFDAAFVTDHNVFGAARRWQTDRAGHPPRLLEGEELSLAGLHIVVLGNERLLHNEPWNGSFDSSLALLDSLGRQPSAISHQPFLIASLPEFWEHHWGSDLGRLVASGVRGFEVWTTSPKAMDFPPAARRTLIARGKLEHLALLGATDMHGLGSAVGVWNVARLPGWRSLGDAELTHALLALLRTAPESVNVIAMDRWQPESRAGRAFAAPMGLLTTLRAASRWHAFSLLIWIWAAVLLIPLGLTGKLRR
jgi:hypothetical protein